MGIGLRRMNGWTVLALGIGFAWPTSAGAIERHHNSGRKLRSSPAHEVLVGGHKTVPHRYSDQALMEQGVPKHQVPVFRKLVDKLPKKATDMRLFGTLDATTRAELFSDLPSNVWTLLREIGTRKSEKSMATGSGADHLVTAGDDGALPGLLPADNRQQVRQLQGRMQEAKQTLSHLEQIADEATPETKSDLAQRFVTRKARTVSRFIRDKMGLSSKHEIHQERLLDALRRQAEDLRLGLDSLQGQGNDTIEGLVEAASRVAEHFDLHAAVAGFVLTAWGAEVDALEIEDPELQEFLKATQHVEEELRSQALQTKTVQAGLEVALAGNEAIARELTVFLDQKLVIHTLNHSLSGIAEGQGTMVNEVNQLNKDVIVGAATINQLKRNMKAVLAMQYDPQQAETDAGKLLDSATQLEEVAGLARQTARPWSQRLVDEGPSTSTRYRSETARKLQQAQTLLEETTVQ